MGLVIGRGSGSDDAEGRSGEGAGDLPKAVKKRGWWQRRAAITVGQDAEPREESREWGVSIMRRGGAIKGNGRAPVVREGAEDTGPELRGGMLPDEETQDYAGSTRSREWGVSIGLRGSQPRHAASKPGVEDLPSAEFETTAEVASGAVNEFEAGNRSFLDAETWDDTGINWSNEPDDLHGAASLDAPTSDPFYGPADVSVGEGGADAGEADLGGNGRTSPRPRGRLIGGEQQHGAIVSGVRNRSVQLLNLIVLAMLLVLPLALISMISAERSAYRTESIQELGAIWGGPQTMTGPFLVIPVYPAPGADAGALSVQAAPLVLLPERLMIDTRLKSDVRKRGVFRVPVYHGRHEISLAINTDYVRSLLAEGETLRWEDTIIGLGISEPRKLQSADILAGGTLPVTFQPGSGVDGLSGIHARIGDPRDRAGDWKVTLQLDGSQQFRLSPAGRLTELRLTSDWPDPEFVGVFPPAFTELGANGFAAEWQVPQLALPQAFRGTEGVSALESAAFGVGLGQGLDLYKSAERAAEFGFGLITLTFVAIFLIERWAGRAVRIGQYFMIGVAQCVSFVLMLAVAERIGFQLAYVLAVAATIVLLTGYGWFVLRLGLRSAWLSGTLLLLYSMLYPVVLASEQVLLVGSVLAFVVIAGFMFGVRRDEWKFMARTT